MWQHWRWKLHFKVFCCFFWYTGVRVSLYSQNWDVLETTVMFYPDRASKLRAPCTKCPELFSEKIIANKADSSCRAEERVSNRVELNELLAKATVFRDRPRGTERPKQINARRGINYLPAETINAAASERNVHKEGSRTQNSKNNNKISGHNQIYFFILF